jgi:ATP-dependent exoDNAse (exonuclease V) beta subunit
MPLSEKQLAAARRSGQDACCVAGPGSGKTRVLVERFAWLARERARPEAILAITFTEKAAQEIKTRLVQHFEDRPELRRRIERALVSTIHGFCHGVLREFATRAGIDPAFRVMDEYEARLEQSRAVEEALNRFSQERNADFQRLAEAWAADDFAAEILDLSERLRLTGGARKALERLPEYDSGRLLRQIETALRAAVEGSSARTAAQTASRDAVLQWLSDAAGDPLDRLERLQRIKLPTGKGVEALNAALKEARDSAKIVAAEAIGERNLPCLATLRDILLLCEAQFAARKRLQGALDFGDLEEKTLQLFEADETIRRTVSERFDAILMDELQDTNPIQWRIVNKIRREGRFFAVGDINQSIFGFRGAEPQQFYAYQQEGQQRGWEIDRLEDNYRSRPEILKAIEAICVDTHLDGIAPHRLQATGDFAPAAGPFVELIRVEGGASEAPWVARRIQELMRELRVGTEQRALRFSDIAILARGAAVFDDYETALRAAGVPCLVQRGRNFFDEPEITDLLNLLRVLVNPLDEPAMLGLLRSPLQGISDEELFARREAGLALAPDAVAARLEALRALREEAPADRLLQRYLDETGHWARLAPAQRANVWKLFRMLREMENGQPGALSQHVEDLQGLRGAAKETNAPVPGAVDAVEVLSVHKAKGLEFPVVFLVSMHKGSGGAQMQSRLALSAARGLGAVWRREGQDATLADGAMLAAEEERKRRERQEEDRLLYVALTRAKERLVLVWTQTPRPSQRWIGPVEQGLGLTWTATAGEASVESGVRVWLVSGTPPVMVADAEAAAGVDRPPGPTAVLAVEPQPISLPQAPSISATALARFPACPRRYFLHYVLKWPEQPGEPRSLEEDPDPDSNIEGSDSGDETVWGPGFGEVVHHILAGAESPGAPQKALELARQFESSDTGRRAARAARAGRETPLLFEFEGLLISATIDLWFEDEGELVVVDYKTNRHIDEERRAEYATQLGLYSIALTRALGRKVDRAVLAVLRDGTEMDVTLGDGGAGRLARLVEEFRAAERTGQFPMRPGKQCEWCAYAGGACPAEQPRTGSAGG